MHGIDVAPILVSLDGNAFFGADAADELLRAVVTSIQRSIGNQQPNIAGSMIRRLGDPMTNRWEALEFFEELRKDGLSVLLLFDEIDSALKLSSGEIGLVLRALISQGHLMAICTSFRWPDEIDLEATFASPWFNVFGVDVLGHFETSESMEMLRVLSSRSGYELSLEECQFLIEVLGNNPFYLQTAGYELFAAQSYASVEPSARPDILRNTVKGLSRVLEFHLQYLVEHLSTESLEILVKVACGKHVPESNALSRLSRSGLVRQVKNNWEVTSGITREFVVALPQPSAGNKLRESGAWKAFTSVARQAFEVAVEKAVETATGKYLT